MTQIATRVAHTHTALPWVVDGDGAFVARVCLERRITAPSVSRLERPDGELIDADAHFIVLACNHHARILAALRQFCADHEASGLQCEGLNAAYFHARWLLEEIEVASVG